MKGIIIDSLWSRSLQQYDGVPRSSFLQPKWPGWLIEKGGLPVLSRGEMADGSGSKGLTAFGDGSDRGGHSGTSNEVQKPSQSTWKTKKGEKFPIAQMASLNWPTAL